MGLGLGLGLANPNPNPNPNQVTITQKGSTVEDTAFGAFADVLRACRPDAV